MTKFQNFKIVKAPWHFYTLFKTTFNV